MFRLFIAAALLLAAAAAPLPLAAQGAAAGRFVVIGCVSSASSTAGAGSGAAAQAKSGFLITDSRSTPPAVYRLDGDPKQFSWLVGQTVEVAGAITPGAGKQPPSIKVASLTRISTTCLKRTP